MNQIEIKHHWDKDKKLLVNQSEVDQQTETYNQIVKLAEKAGLIAMAAGGYIVLMHPRTQLDEDRYHVIQWATDNRYRCQKPEVL